MIITRILHIIINKRIFYFIFFTLFLFSSRIFNILLPLFYFHNMLSTQFFHHKILSSSKRRFISQIFLQMKFFILAKERDLSLKFIFIQYNLYLIIYYLFLIYYLLFLLIYKFLHQINFVKGNK